MPGLFSFTLLILNNYLGILGLFVLSSFTLGVYHCKHNEPFELSVIMIDVMLGCFVSVVLGCWCILSIMFGDSNHMTPRIALKLAFTYLAGFTLPILLALITYYGIVIIIN
jgi:hypothetical protein